jgi:hypothetical protein
MNIKIIFIISLLFNLLACSSLPKERHMYVTDKNPITHKNLKSGIASLMSNDAKASYETKFISAKNHKAFSQSDSGAWSWKANRTSIDHAKTNALIACQKNNIKYEKTYPCKIININGLWLNERNNSI